MAAEEAAVAAKSQRQRRTAGDMMWALPEHVLQEILSRVGTIKDLFMLAATCRRWRGRFTDRSFLRDLLLCPSPSSPAQVQSLLGFFLQQQDAHEEQQLASSCSFLPAAPAGPGNGRSPPPRFGLDAATMARALTSSCDSDHAVPLASRRGIVLMQQRVPRDTHLLLGVCNPVTGQRHLLAPLDTTPDICCYAIVTAADANNAGAGRYTFSQLVVATVELSASDWAMHLHSYSAATSSWSAPPATLHLINGCRYSLVGQRSAVVHHGAAHWLWRYDDTDTDTGGGDDGSTSSLFKLTVPLGGVGGGRFAFTRIPVRVVGGGGGGGSSPVLCVTGDGDFAVVYVYASHVAVSTYRRPPQQQQAAGGHGRCQAWERRAAFTVPAAVPYADTPPPIWQNKEEWFHLGGGSISMLVLYRSGAVSVVDLHGKTMEKVMDCFVPLFDDQLKGTTAVPYEMDLVDFFMMQLGGGGLRSAGSSG